MLPSLAPFMEWSGKTSMLPQRRADPMRFIVRPSRLCVFVARYAQSYLTELPSLGALGQHSRGLALGHVLLVVGLGGQREQPQDQRAGQERADDADYDAAQHRDVLAARDHRQVGE